MLRVTRLQEYKNLQTSKRKEKRRKDRVVNNEMSYRQECRNWTVLSVKTFLDKLFRNIAFIFYFKIQVTVEHGLLKRLPGLFCD
jgi:hypothetical protein